MFALGPRVIAGATVWPEIIVAFPLAWLLGIVFQYFTIVPMCNDVGRPRGAWLAIRADTLSIVAFQVGLFAWMILSAKVIREPPLHINTSTHWWMMQVGMILGFFTAYPVNRWLVTKGWQEKMDERTHLAQMLVEQRDDAATADVPHRHGRRQSVPPRDRAITRAAAGRGAGIARR